MTPRDAERFISEICDMFFDGPGDVEYSDFLELGVECGILKVEPFDPHNPDHEGVEGEMEPGDDIYLVVPPNKS